MQISKNKKILLELQDSKKIELCAFQYGVTGDKTRLKICYLLCHHPELSVSSIAEAVKSPISTVSRSLKKLREARVVTRRKKALTVFYSLDDNDFVSSLKDQLLT